ncbi:MAG TPA: fatty acid desaturase [Planctomycetaceae bacterium]|nr:fatty acid desaturase [Planctomycetaceae bacterium]
MNTLQTILPHSSIDVELPSLPELGCDLLHTTPGQRVVALARPFIGVAAFFVAAHLEWWFVTPLILFLTFIAVVTVTHDVVHNSLGLNRKQTDVALFLLGAILFESGHAYRATHSQHHSVFPDLDDPEGEPARMSFWRAVIHGPLFLPILWLWAIRRSRGSDRLWLVIEAVWCIAGVVGAGLFWPVVPAFSLYVLLAVIGSWVYPLLTVHLPHRHYGDSPLNQTHTLRGVVIPKLFLELTYHLEHHLYPQVPSHNLPELSRRLEPAFHRFGVKPVRVP